MFFKAFIDEQLSQYSYLVGCQESGEAIIVDPARNIEQYFQTSEMENLDIIAATETHIHADFLSGARELGIKYNIKLYLSDEGGEEWKYQYLQDVNYEKLKNGSTFNIGNISFDVLHTPGHTPASISLLLKDGKSNTENYMGIFTGDFLFVGDVGRPDLLEIAADMKGTAVAGAKDMFNSIRKLERLPGFLQVWPGHGAGSACGKSLGAVPMSTIGYEGVSNWALKENSKNLFVKELISDQPNPPRYFSMMKKMNKSGPPLLREDKIKEIRSFDNIKSQTQADKYVVIDTRNTKEYAKKHIKGTINIPYDQSFTNMAGWFVDYHEKIFLICDKNNLEAIVKSLQSIGLDDIGGYLKSEQLNESFLLEEYKNITPLEAEELLQRNKAYLLDVRDENEWNEERIDGAHHCLLGNIEGMISNLPMDKTIILQCRTGRRSAIGVSLLRRKGITDLVNLTGGIVDWKEQQLPIIKKEKECYYEE